MSDLFEIVPETPEQTVGDPTPDPELPRGNAIVAMILGIVAIANIGIGGIVLGCIANKMGNRILQDYADSPVSGFANAGRILGKIALIVSMVSLGVAVFAGLQMLP